MVSIKIDLEQIGEDEHESRYNSSLDKKLQLKEDDEKLSIEEGKMISLLEKITVLELLNKQGKNNKNIFLFCKIYSPNDFSNILWRKEIIWSKQIEQNQKHPRGFPIRKD